MKYLTDEHVPLLLAALLRRAGVDVLTAQECGLLHTPDRDLLLYAAQSGRCLITANVRDFPNLAREFAEQGIQHAGIACGFGSIPTNQAPEISAFLVRLHEQYPEGAYPDFFVYLSKSRYS